MFQCFKIPGYLWHPREIEEVCNYLFSDTRADLIKVRLMSFLGIELSEDVYQNLYLRIKEKGFPDYDPRKSICASPQEKFSAFFFGRLRNRGRALAKTEIKRRSKICSIDSVREICADDNTDEEELETAALQSAVADCVAALSPALKEAVEARYYKNQSYAEMAQNLDLLIGTVGKRLFSAIRKLRFCLEKKGHDFGKI